MLVACAGCDKPILDKFLLNVLERTWHAECVRCFDCHGNLTDKCFSREGKLFCRNDFYRRYGTKCGGCAQGISPQDLVRKARDKVFHLNCFTCMVCRKQLSTGEELYVLDDNKFICKDDYMSGKTHQDSLLGSGSEDEDEECEPGVGGGAALKGGAGAAGAGGPPTPAPTPAPAADLLGMFPPMIDMSSTQALLSMVRSANAPQLENYLKGASSRRPAESSPLDLSPGAVVPPPGKRRAYHAPSRSLGESLFASKDTHRLRRLGSVSPKPRPPAPPSAAPAAPGGGARVLPCPSLCGAASAATCAPDAAATAAWTVDDVAAFVGSIDLCAEYAQNFREQRIDGCALPLLTEEHLTGALGMRLGPALKLRAALSRRLGQCAACAHCLHCHAPQPQQPSSAGHSPTSRPASTGV